MTIKIITWNVNGIRAIIRKNELQKIVESEKMDFFCLNEIKINNQIKNKVLDQTFKYHYWNFAKKKGYSGTAIFTNMKPINVITSPFDDEGRLLHLEYKKFILICIYVPNSKPKLDRLDYRINNWGIKIKNYIKKLKKPVVLTGDMNVAHLDIDIHNPNGSKLRAGWTNKERNDFSILIKENQLIDTFRNKHPKLQQFTYWDYRSKARERNKGWRIDYFLVSKRFNKYIKDSYILNEYNGSDHVPIVLLINLLNI